MKRPTVAASETYFEIDHMRGQMMIRGYQLIAKEDDDKLLAAVKNKIETGGFCKETYRFEKVEYVGEKLFEYGEKQVPTYECHVQCMWDDRRACLADIFSHLLRRNVMIHGGEEETGIAYYFEPIGLGSGNYSSHSGLFDKGGRKMNMIWWKNTENPFTGVLSRTEEVYQKPLKFVDLKLPIVSDSYENNFRKHQDEQN